MKAPTPRNSNFWTGRYQIGIVSIFIILEAALITFFPGRQPVSITVIVNTAAFCLLANAIGVGFIKGVARYPGVEEASYVLVGLMASYGILIVALLMLRIAYSRLLIGTSFVTSGLALLTLYTILRRRTRLCIGLIPEGAYHSVVRSSQVEWRILDTPEHSAQGVDAVSADLRNDISDEWERRLAVFALEGVPVYDLKHLRESLTGKVQIEQLSENSLGTLSPLYAWMTIKHMLDWLAAFVALLIMLPFLTLVAIVIKLDSSGPVLFNQTRVGYRGRPFQVYKLRTMTVSPVEGGLESYREAAMTKELDQRITRLGRWLRQSRIDEIPQLINVLKGEMSWIGPRPEAQILSHWYESEIPFYRYRHIVRPGITGWAQVNQGHVADVKNVTEKLHYDFYYIKHFSFWIDLVIIGRTIRTIMTGFGAR